MGEQMIKVATWARERVKAARAIRITDSTIQQAAETCAGGDTLLSPNLSDKDMDDVAVLLWILAEERARLRHEIGDLRLLLDVERVRSAPRTPRQLVRDAMLASRRQASS